MGTEDLSLRGCTFDFLIKIKLVPDVVHLKATTLIWLLLRLKEPRFNTKSVLILLKQVRPQHTAVEEITNLGQKERAYPWELRI